MESIEKIQKHMTLVHEVNINASPKKIWDFLINIEKNYKAWHPDDHILFHWTKGAPFEKGQLSMPNRIWFPAPVGPVMSTLCLDRIQVHVERDAIKERSKPRFMRRSRSSIAAG
jgi:hypothetical protein